MLKASKHEAISKIRSRQRAVADDDVDRPQVEAGRPVQPSGTNCPKHSGKRDFLRKEGMKQIRPAFVDRLFARVDIESSTLPSCDFQAHNAGHGRVTAVKRD